VSLPPKAFAVLYDLVTHLAGRLDDAGIQAQRALEMTFWLPRAKTALRQPSGCGA